MVKSTLAIVALLLAIFSQVRCLSIVEDIVGDFLDQVVSRVTGQRPSNENGTASEFREFALTDKADDVIAKFKVNAVQKILVRSGYKHESHYVLADDGYITQLVRIINPLADKSKLKRPPVMLFHGGIIDTTAYIFASPIQHHPEKYPRVEGDPPITSWNRSLGLMLANNGYDVWLVGTRGAIREGRGRIRRSAPKAIKNRQVPITEENYNKVAFVKLDKSYWEYSMDQITHFEVPRQIEKVLQVTKAKKLSLFGYSYSSQTLLSLLSSDQEISKRVHNLMIMAPLINQDGANRAIKFFQDNLCANLPNQLGISLVNELILTDGVVELFVEIFKDPGLRYNIYKLLLNIIAGPSPKYSDIISLGNVRHALVPTGFVEMKQWCQQVRAGQLQAFDYGSLENMNIYGTSKPPAYNISNINVRRLLLIGGGKDTLSSRTSQQYVLNRTRTTAYVFIPSYSHLDLIVRVDNDIKVNLPILEFLNSS